MELSAERESIFDDILDLLASDTVALLVSYFDDSGTHGAPIVVVGGALASKDQWASLATDWSAFLALHGVKQFHAADFSNSWGEFKGWDEPKKTPFIKTLAAIINDNIQYLVAQIVKVNVLEAVLRDYPEFKVTPYQLCAERCLAAITNWTQRHNAKPVAVLFEAGPKVRSDMFKLYEENVKFDWVRENYGIASISVTKKKQDDGTFIRQFEAADYVAYEIFKYHVNLVEQPLLDTRKSLLALLGNPTWGYVESELTLRIYFGMLRKTKEQLAQKQN